MKTVNLYYVLYGGFYAWCEDCARKKGRTKRPQHKQVPSHCEDCGYSAN